MIRALSKKSLLTFVGLTVGVVGRSLYWKYVDCTGGIYPTTSSPANSALWGVVMDGLFLNLFKTGSIPKRTD